MQAMQWKVTFLSIFRNLEQIQFFPSDTLIYGISRDGYKILTCTCEHMNHGQLTMGANQTKMPPWLSPKESHLVFNFLLVKYVSLTFEWGAKFKVWHMFV